MGFFSRLAYECADPCISAEKDYLLDKCVALRMRLEDLQDRLDEAELLRPHDFLHPLFDRWFFDDGEGTSVQGLLRAISETKERIAELEWQEDARHQFAKSIWDTGATPDGQVVLLNVFSPLLDAAV